MKQQPPFVRQKVLKDRTWFQRNPRLFVGLFTTSCLLVLFSRPLYDAFIRDYPPVPAERQLRK
jgi:hypothetical protein